MTVTSTQPDDTNCVILPESPTVDSVAATQPEPRAEKSTDISAFLRLVHPDTLCEVRIPNAPEKAGRTFKATWSGYFDDPRLAQQWIQSIERKVRPDGIYFTLNPVRRDLKARAANRLEWRAKHTTTDKDIAQRRWLVIDIDPVRPAGLSSTNEETLAAIRVSRKIRHWLAEQGWPMPVRMLSGNGCYLIFRIDLPNDEVATTLVKDVINAIADQFSTDAVDIDRSVFNSARIIKVPGTKARKGDDVEDRPHRQAFFVVPDGKIGVVSREQLEAVASMAERPQPVSPSPQASSVGFGGSINPRNVERCRRYVAKMAPAIEGEKGSSKTLEVGATTARFGLSIEESWPVMQEYNERCLPPWDERDLQRKLEQGHAAAIKNGEWAVKVRDDQRLVDPPASPAAAETSATRDFAFAEGMRVQAGDRGNVGTVVAVHADACDVQFVSREGNIATKRLSKSELTPIGGPGPDDPESEEDDSWLEPMGLASLIDTYPDLREPIVDGVLRRGEIGNVIASPKLGKSFLGAGMAIAIAQGADWLGFATKQGPVLILDNELHKETIASRMYRVASDLMVDYRELEDSIRVVSVRGRNLTVDSLGRIKGIEPGMYSMVILDALYRALPEETSENDNAAMMRVYNTLDHYARVWDCAVTVIHHTSKGTQSDKGVTDVGSGAGSISRAADSHLIIRPHETDGLAVMEAVTRSFRPPEPKSLRFDWPLWSEVSERPEVRKPGRRKEAEQAKQDSESAEKILEAIPPGSEGIQRARLAEKFSFGDSKFSRLMGKLAEEDRVEIIRKPPAGGGRESVHYIRTKPNPV